MGYSWRANVRVFMNNKDFFDEESSLFLFEAMFS